MVVWNEPPRPFEAAISNICITSPGGADGYCPRKKAEGELAWDTQRRGRHMGVRETVQHPLRTLESRAQEERNHKEDVITTPPNPHPVGLN